MSIGWLKDERGIARRAFLGGAGTVVALPILESLLPREARAQAAIGPRRIITYYVGNGHVMPDWTPKGTGGKTYTMSPNLAPLESLRQDILVITGLNNAPAMPDMVGDHASGTSGSFTAAKALKSTTMLKLAPSVEQIAAAQNGKLTRIPSIQLGMEEGKLVGGCDSGYACAYSNSISWASEANPLFKITNPQVAFDLLFKGVDPMTTQADLAKRRAYKKSVLDFALKDGDTLAAKLGRSDLVKLDQYRTGVREVERQALDMAAPLSCKATPLGAVPPTDWKKLSEVFSDIMVLAMQCDVTRHFSFMFSDAVTHRVYTEFGATRGHHDISHHGNSAANLAILTKISTFEVQQLGYMLGKMKAAPEGDKDVLYNSTLIYTSDVSDGNRHNHNDMPILVAGHGGGLLNTGQHVIYPDVVPKKKVGNLLTTALRTVGITDKMVGDGDGILPEIVNA